MHSAATLSAATGKPTSIRRKDMGCVVWSKLTLGLASGNAR